MHGRFLDAVDMAFIHGTLVEPEGLAELRAAHAAAPQDLETRARMLRAMAWLYRSMGPSEDFLKEVEWWIRHQPKRAAVYICSSAVSLASEHADYLRLKDAWIAALADTPDDLEVNLAASELFRTQEPDLALATLERAHALEPEHMDLQTSIGQIWLDRAREARSGGDADSEARAASQALRWLTMAVGAAKNLDQRSQVLGSACLAAVFAHEFDRAHLLSQEALELAARFPLIMERGDARYSAHEALGLLALHAGDNERAKRELGLAAKALKGQDLDSTGISFDLANALLQRSEQASVLAFLREVVKHWKVDHMQIYEWCRQLKRGGSPPLTRLGGE